MTDWHDHFIEASIGSDGRTVPPCSSERNGKNENTEQKASQYRCK